MQIVIEDGEPVVRLRKGEENSLQEAERLCGELQKWLGNAEAGKAAEALAGVVAAYVAKEQLPP